MSIERDIKFLRQQGGFIGTLAALDRIEAEIARLREDLNEALAQAEHDKFQRLHAEDELARLREDAETSVVNLNHEIARLREELKDTRENSWGADEAVAYERMEAELAGLRSNKAAYEATAVELARLRELIAVWDAKSRVWFEASDARPYDAEVAARATWDRRKAEDALRNALKEMT